MSHAVSSKRHRSRGQALVEFALVAPFFFLLLFSIIEFGRAVYYIQILNNAAREGARYAIVHGEKAIITGPSGPSPSDTASWPAVSTSPDPTGANIAAAARNFAFGIIDTNSSDFQVTIQWRDFQPALPPACLAAARCRTITLTTGGTVLSSSGDIGDNGRDNSVNVQVTYTFRPLIAAVVPLPTFTLTGGSTLVINN